jgi:membrane protease YdiL (CAAX protease family)
LKGQEGNTPDIQQALLVILGAFSLILVGGLIGGGESSKWMVLLLEGIILIPALIVLVVKRLSFRTVFRWNPISFPIILSSIFLGLGLGIVLDEVDRLIQSFFPIPEELATQIQDLMTGHSSGDWILILLSSVVVAPLVEEMLFRGFLQGALERRLEITKAVLAAAFIFACIHVNPWWFVEILILGVLLGVLTWRSGSIFPAIIVHGINNGLAIGLINTKSSHLEWILWKNHVHPILVLLGIGAVILSFVCIYSYTENRLPSYKFVEST